MITSVPVPRINTNDDQVEVVSWHVATGAHLDVGAEVVDVETSKAVVTLYAEQAGYVRPLLETGAIAQVGQPLYLMASTPEALADHKGGAPGTEAPGPTSAPAAAGSPLVAPNAGFSPAFSTTRFSRAAMSLLEQRGIPADRFPGSGLVTARMLSGDMSAVIKCHDANSGAGVTVRSLPVPSHAVRRERVSLGKMAEIRMLERGESGNINSKLSVYFDSAPIRDRLVREQSFDGNIQPLLLFEISRLLRNWPQFTACYAGDAVHYYDRVDIGLALDFGKGLKVVTLSGADRMMPIDFHERMIEFGLRYLDNTLRPEDLTGSTITVTDLSGFNVLHFHPLINGEQSAIIGIGGDAEQPGCPMSINMTFDHRVSNGREVALFLGELRSRLLSYVSPSPAETLSVEPSGPAACDRCDTCGIGIVDYYREYGRIAYMRAYFREDGTLGGVCHRCQDCWM